MRGVAPEVLGLVPLRPVRGCSSGRERSGWDLLTPEGGQAQTGEVDGVAEYASGFLVGMESHGIFGFHEVSKELGGALVPLGRPDRRRGAVPASGPLDARDQVEERVDRNV